MLWSMEDEDEEEDLRFSPALMARRASESWINTPPIELQSSHLAVAFSVSEIQSTLLPDNVKTAVASQNSHRIYTSSIPVPMPLQRKKSLPDVQGLPKATEPMSREEVSVLSSARREELRRMQDEAEKLRANPLLYLVSPHVKDWFSRQQLVMLVLFVNISLAIMFFKLLT